VEEFELEPDQGSLCVEVYKLRSFGRVLGSLCLTATCSAHSALGEKTTFPANSSPPVPLAKIQSEKRFLDPSWTWFEILGSSCEAGNGVNYLRIHVVARDGFEPPTPAFSGLRSTPELPGHFGVKSHFTIALPLLCDLGAKEFAGEY
jgi:hypothetical protein